MFFLSGGVDGYCCVWNQFTGVMKYALTLPDSKIQTDPEKPRRGKKIFENEEE